jgi:hypothetical protein
VTTTWGLDVRERKRKKNLEREVKTAKKFNNKPITNEWILQKSGNYKIE